MSQESPTPSPHERRRFYRAGVVPGSSLRVRAWKIPYGVPLARRPIPAQELRIGVRQVCVGGLTVAVGGDNDLHAQVKTTDRLRIEIQYGDDASLVEGRLRDVPHAATGPEALQTGVVFQGRDGDLGFREARSQLSRIVGSVQREEIRRLRAGQTQTADPDAPAAQPNPVTAPVIP